MKNRMGDNPLDMLMSSSATEETVADAKPKRKAKAAAPPAKKAKLSKAQPPASDRTGRAHATFHLPVELVEASRDAVSALAGPPLHLTLANLAERALRAELQRLQKQHNNGEPFPRRRAPIRTGRPIE